MHAVATHECGLQEAKNDLEIQKEAMEQVCPKTCHGCCSCDRRILRYDLRKAKYNRSGNVKPDGQYHQEQKNMGDQAGAWSKDRVDGKEASRRRLTDNKCEYYVIEAVR